MPVMNPESTIMQQTEGYWQNIAALLLYKLSKTEEVKIFSDDIVQFQQSGLALLTNGHHDSIGFKLVTHEEAVRLAQYDAERRASYEGKKQ